MKTSKTQNMKNVSYTVLIIGILGVVASIFNFFYQASYDTFDLTTLWPSLSLIFIAYKVRDKKTLTKQHKEI